MDARRKEIETLDADYRRLEHQITAECVEIGRRAAAIAPATVRTAGLAKHLNSAPTLPTPRAVPHQGSAQVPDLPPHPAPLHRGLPLRHRAQPHPPPGDRNPFPGDAR